MQTNHDILNPSRRIGSLATLVCMIVLLGFFAAHGWANTGFFTGKFGPPEMLALYGPIVISFVAPVVRAVSGRQNPARPFEAATNLSLAVGSLWLALVFPFNFVHLTDVLPATIRFIFSWITDDIGRWVLILQVVIGAVATPWTLFTFFTIRRRAATA